MPKLSRLLSLTSAGLLTVFSVSAACAQSQQAAGPRGLAKQIGRIDFALQGAYVASNAVSGRNYLNQNLNHDVSKTFGALIQLRYTKSPLVGFEYNFNYSRATQGFTNTTANTALTVQAVAQEHTLGYVAHGPTFAGLQTFASAGAGVTHFVPTRLGGVGLPSQARATYYYGVGVEAPVFTPNFGVRVQFRQAIRLAPDFGQNYLTIKQRNFTTEPAFGFYYHF